MVWWEAVHWQPRKWGVPCASVHRACTPGSSSAVEGVLTASPIVSITVWNFPL